jgi:hypothetical protein
MMDARGGELEGELERQGSEQRHSSSLALTYSWGMIPCSVVVRLVSCAH